MKGNNNNFVAFKLVRTLSHATPPYDKGTCKISKCEKDFADCNNDPKDGCENDLTSTVTSCASCGNMCKLAHTTPQCVMSICKIGMCDAGFADCDVDDKTGCEIDTTTDAANCGGCGKACRNVN